MNYSKRRLRKKRILTLIIITIGLIYIPLKLTQSTAMFSNSSLSKYELSNKLKKYELSNKLKKESKSNYKIRYILNNMDKYPTELLELLSRNTETVDFVYDYPNHRDKIIFNKISIKKYYKPGKIPLFLQWDKKWGYDFYGNEPIAISGCAPTSLAMVAVGLTGNTRINPLVVSNYAYKHDYYVNGVGSSWSLISEGAKHFGLNSQELPLSKSSILSTLKEGFPIIVTVGPGTFTTTGHFLVLTGLTDDGKVTINDPNSKINSSKSWDVDIFLKEAKNLWKMSKL